MVGQCRFMPHHNPPASLCELDHLLFALHDVELQRLISGALASASSSAAAVQCLGKISPAAAFGKLPNTACCVHCIPFKLFYLMFVAGDLALTQRLSLFARTD